MEGKLARVRAPFRKRMGRSDTSTDRDLLPSAILNEVQYVRSCCRHCYKCANGFVFEVPVTDTNDAVFKDEDKGIFFMRWIRKALDQLNNGV